MKTATKVFLIIGIVTSSLLLLSALAMFFMPAAFNAAAQLSVREGTVAAEDAEVAQTAVAVVFITLGVSYVAAGVLGLIFSLLSLKKLQTATDRKQLIAYGILCMIFGYFPSGLLMLLMKNTDLSPQTAAENTTATTPFEELN